MTKNFKNREEYEEWQRENLARLFEEEFIFAEPLSWEDYQRQSSPLNITAETEKDKKESWLQEQTDELSKMCTSIVKEKIQKKWGLSGGKIVINVHAKLTLNIKD